jgi:hypothetical protein
MSIALMQQPALLIPIAAILGGVLIALVAMVLSHFRGLRQAELDANLKQDMINRGMSVADIERILWASSARGQPEADKPDPISDNEYYLVEKLVDEGKTAEEIERIIRAFRPDRDTTGLRDRIVALR